MVARPMTIMKGVTSRSALVRPVRISPSTSNGTVPTQYLDHSNARRSSGEERSSHICRPSSDTAGEMKRGAIQAGTEADGPSIKKRNTIDAEETDRLAPLQVSGLK